LQACVTSLHLLHIQLGEGPGEVHLFFVFMIDIMLDS